METKQISPGVFYASEGGSSLLYSPKDKTVMEVQGFNPETAGLPQFQKFLRDTFTEAPKDFPAQDFSFSPTSTTLFLTSDCNSRCIYCYSDAGARKINLPFAPAKAAIDLVIANALKKGEKTARLYYHGGGEPTVNWPVLVQSREYMGRRCEEEGLELKPGLSTNCIIPPEKMIWLMDNFSGIQISFDGPPHIQNRQRPLAGGKPSYDIARANIDLLRQCGKEVSLRATITQDGLPELSLIVEHLMELAGPNGNVHIEPVASEWGRCLTTGCVGPCDSEFKDAFLDAERRFGKSIVYSGGQLHRVTEYFCTGAGRNFCVTPEQYVSSCFEVSLKDDERNRIFFFGRFDQKAGEFVFDMDKLKVLRSRKADNIKECENCFAKYNCAGDCLAKSAASGDIFKVPQNKRCESNRGILFHRLLGALSKGEPADTEAPFIITRVAKTRGVTGLAESVLLCTCPDCGPDSRCSDDYD